MRGVITDPPPVLLNSQFEGALPSYNFAPRNNFSSSEDSRRGKAPSSVTRVDGFGARGEGIYTEPSQFTDDAGYHTAATSQSRALSQNSQNQPKLQRKGLTRDRI